MQKTIYAAEYRLLLDWLRRQRKQRGLTMREMGKLLNVHHSWIGRIEQGERRLDIMEYARLCDRIGCDAAEGMLLIAPSVKVARLRKVEIPPVVYRIRRPPRSNPGTET